MKHKVAFIGAGDVVRRSYLPALAQRSDCTVVGVCSQSIQSAREVANQYGIEQVFATYQELLLQPEIDTVFICTPTYLHRPMAEAAIAQQKHILVEKPLCATYQDSQALLKQAAGYSKTFYVAFNNQFRGENQWLKHQVQAGKAGKIELIDFAWYRTKRYEAKAWLYRPEQSGGGVLIDLGAHLIHFALSLLPDRHEFTAYGHTISHQPNVSSVEDTAIGMVTVDSQTTILIKLGWAMQLATPSMVTLEVLGPGGRFSNRDYQAVEANIKKTSGFEPLLEEFFRHIEAGTRPDLYLVDDTMLVLDKLYQSSQTGASLNGNFCGARNEHDHRG
jgi:predicted dehydrogenase